MVSLCVRLCKYHNKNFNEVPNKIKDKVRAVLEEDGYIILDDGTVIKDMAE